MAATALPFTLPAVLRRAVVIALVVAGVAAGACSGKGGSAGPPPTEGPPAPISWTVTVGDVHAVHPPAPPFPDDVRDEVTATLERYLTDAVLGPLRSGQPAGDLAPLFTPAAAARLNGPDRAALVDEGLPPAPAVRSEAATAGLAALAAPDGAVIVVTATVDLRLHTGGTDSVAVVRTGDLVLAPDGDGWDIEGYDVRTTRDPAEGAGTTTTAKG